MLQPLLSVAFFTVAAASVVAQQQSVPESTCVELVSAAKGQSERDAAYGVYTRCRLKGSPGGILEPGCRELVRLYSVARHYKDASGTQLVAEEFCATAVGVTSEQGPMQELDACVAGAEEVLSSSEVSEAAEKACRRAHPKAAEAPAACRMYVASLAEALHRTPAGELVDAEAICGKLVEQQAAPVPVLAHQVNAVAATPATNDADPEERKFVSSCVQFAGNLMNNPAIGEAQVIKSCEDHLSATEQTFCNGYARLVTQKADAVDFSNFCVAEYRRMSITSKPAAPVQQPKKAAPVAMNMKELCEGLFDQAVSASLSGPELRRTASDLCTQNLNALAPAQRPPATRIRVGCKFFANRLVKMKEQQGTATTSEAFCARIAGPQHPPAAVAAVARSSPIQAHGPASLLAPTPGVSRPSPQIEQSLPVLSASAALPALAAAAAAPVPQPAGPADIAKAKSDDDFLSKFLNKYEAGTAGAEAAASKLSTILTSKLSTVMAATPAAEPAQPMKVFRDDEMDEVRRKAEQLFGSDVDPTDPSAAPAVTAPAVTAPAVTAPAVTADAVAEPAPAAEKPAVVAVAPTQPVLAAVTVAPPAAAAAAAKVTLSGKVTPVAASTIKKTNLLQQGNEDASDFLSSFLTAYSGNTDASKAASQSPLLAPMALPAQPPAAPAFMPAAAAAPVALLENPSALAPKEEGAVDMDSLVSAFLAKSGN